MSRKKFAFLIHPRETSDLGRLFGKKIGIGESLGMTLFPDRPAEWLIKHLKGRAGFTVCSKFRVFDQADGYLVGVYLTARQMIEMPRKKVIDRIMEAILFAQNHLGCERVGLGAYTAPLLCNGKTVVNDSRITCSITHGDALSAASVIPAVTRGAELKGKSIADSTIAVVGAYGLVGRAASVLLADISPKRLIMTGPNANKLRKAADEISGYHGEIVVSTSNQTIQEADIVVLCTTANGDIATASTFKENAVVLDMAQPHNMSEAVSKARPDVLRLDGGYMAIPGVDTGFTMGLPRETAFACLTETMVTTILDVTEHHVGSVDVNFARRVFGMAQGFGFDLAPLTSFSRKIDLN